MTKGTRGRPRTKNRTVSTSVRLNREQQELTKTVGSIQTLVDVLTSQLCPSIRRSVETLEKEKLVHECIIKIHQREIEYIDYCLRKYATRNLK